MCALPLVAALVAAGCGGPDGGQVAADPTTAETAAPAAEAPALRCRGRGRPKPRVTAYDAPKQTVNTGARLTARVRTNCGEFSIALDPKRSPKAVNSFVFLARNGFYDGVPFDEAGAGKYLHGGDPPGPAEGPGYGVSEEVPNSFIYRRRVVALTPASGDPRDRVGSQFFIIVAEPWLDIGGDHPPIGKVEDGFGVVDRISRLGPGDADAPSNLGVIGDVGPLRRPVAIESISIERGQ